MKFFFNIVLFLSTSFIFGQNQTNSIGFIENKGQIVDQNQKENKEVKYLLNTSGFNVQIRNNGFSYDVYEIKEAPLNKENSTFYKNSTLENNQQEFPKKLLIYNFHRIDINFLNANTNSKLIAEDQSSDYDNFFNISHAPEGITNVHKYRKVTYKNIYNNIDVEFFIPKDSTKVVEYNFIIRPGGKISDIQLKFNGAKTNLIDNKIRMKVKFGEMEEIIPFSWKENNGKKEAIKITYNEISKNTYSFNSNIDISNKTIVIDPTPIRLWGTFYGTGGNTYEGYHLSTDNMDNVYYSGSTSNPSNIATSGSFQASLNGTYDGFLVKFNTNGQRLWGTYYGGSNVDNILATDIRNNFIVITGATQSSNNIATTGTHNINYTPGNGSNFNKNDCFVAKFNLDGIRIWGTYFGGESKDDPRSITIDNNNNIILIGNTYSLTGISTPGSFKENRTQPVNINAIGEGFISKFNESGNLIWSTYYGLCEIRGVDTDSNLNIFISGDTESENVNPYIATTGTHQPIYSYNSSGSSYHDSFIGKFNPNGQRQWGTYFGGYGAEYNFNLKIDLENNIYISGYTRSSELISTLNSHQEVFGGISDAYLAKFNQNGNIIWGTYYGGTSGEQSQQYTIDINSYDEIFLSGSTRSVNNISTTGTYAETLNGVADCFIAKFNKFGGRIWGTYFGGSSTDYNKKIALDNSGGIYIMGYSYSTNGITTPGAFQQTFSNDPGHFIVKFLDCQSAASITSNSPVCINSEIQLNASGGTNYQWTGPNGFTSTEQNPVIPDASALNNGTYSCEITGSIGGCDNTVSVNVFVGDNLAPIPDIQNLPIISGDCNTVVSIFPTATDNCSGTITGTTNDPLTYLNSGNYTITWTYDDGNGNTIAQTQDVIIDSVPLPTTTSPQNFCIQDNATLNDIQITGQNLTWYDAPTGGTVLANNTILQDGTYYVSQSIDGCESDRTMVNITVQNTPAAIANQNQTFCETENATLNEININGTTIIWYEDPIGNTILDNTTTLADGLTYYATQTVNGCESPQRVAITIQLINTLNANDYATIICDDANDNIETIDLTSYNSLLINSAGNSFRYYHNYNGAQNETASDEITNFSNYDLIVGTEIIYTRIDSPNSCYQIVELQLTLVSKPDINIKDITPICEGSQILIDAGNGYDTYLWSTGENTPSIIVNTPGNYSVTVFENHGNITCSTTQDFNVVHSNAATITNIITSDWTATDNIITINVTGSGNYEYSLDGINYQDHNIFVGLENGEYTIYVRDKNGCGIKTDEIYLLMYPKYFTPNGDGHNDFWRIKLSKNEPNLTIKIFDRYGKLMKQLDSNDIGWDGTYQGEKVVSTDYWFVVTRENGKEHKGHFTLKR